MRSLILSLAVVTMSCARSEPASDIRPITPEQAEFVHAKTVVDNRMARAKRIRDCIATYTRQMNDQIERRTNADKYDFDIDVSGIDEEDKVPVVLGLRNSFFAAGWFGLIEIRKVELPSRLFGGGYLVLEQLHVELTSGSSQ